jgi:hypothetical protein
MLDINSGWLPLQVQETVTPPRASQRQGYCRILDEVGKENLMWAYKELEEVLAINRERPEDEATHQAIERLRTRLDDFLGKWLREQHDWERLRHIKHDLEQLRLQHYPNTSAALAEVEIHCKFSGISMSSQDPPAQK